MSEAVLSGAGGLPALGVRLHGGQPGAEALALARAADHQGFAALWFAENAFARGILPLAGACAVATRRIGIGAGVFNPFSRHPTMMAMEAAALDELSGGRATLSLGAGIGAAVRRLGQDAGRPLGALRDTLAIVRGLLRGETVTRAGGAFTADGVRLDVTPRPGIAVLLAGRGPLTVRLAGEAADGLVVSNMCSAGFAGACAAAAADARRAAGRPGLPRVVQYMPCAVGDDAAEVAARAMRAVGAMLPGYWALGEHAAPAREALLLGTGIGAAEFAAAVARLRAGEDAAAVLDARHVAAFALAGTPAECLAGARRYAAAGVGELALTFSGPGAAAELRLLGAALRDAGGG